MSSSGSCFSFVLSNEGTFNTVTLIKILELIIAFICNCLHTDSCILDFFTQFLSATAFGGYCIIRIGGFVGRLISSPIGKNLEIFFCLAGFALFEAAGALNIHYYQWVAESSRRTYGLAKGYLGVVNGVVFLLDAIFTWRSNY